LRVIWKWKYLILAGTLICISATAIISFNKPKIYPVEMVIEPGVLRINERGNKIYVDSAANIKALVDAGAFNPEIIKHLETSNSNKKPISLRFKVSTPKNTNFVKISYETTVVDMGIKILNNLTKALIKEYTERVKYFQGEYETKILLKKKGISGLDRERHAAQTNINNTQKRLNDLRSELEFLKSNNTLLVEQRNRMVSSKKPNDALPAFVYGYTIQQNLVVENNYKNQMFDYMSKKEEAELDLKRIHDDMETLSKEIEDLENEKNDIGDLRILQPPTSSPDPIKPNTKRNVMLSAVLGLFMMVFLAFLIEYLSKYKSKEHQ
jgi:capsular polysaccharide biosynthesis protein